MLEHKLQYMVKSSLVHETNIESNNELGNMGTLKDT